MFYGGGGKYMYFSSKYKCKNIVKKYYLLKYFTSKPFLLQNFFDEHAHNMDMKLPLKQECRAPTFKRENLARRRYSGGVDTRRQVERSASSQSHRNNTSPKTTVSNRADKRSAQTKAKLKSDSARNSVSDNKNDPANSSKSRIPSNEPKERLPAAGRSRDFRGGEGSRKHENRFNEVAGNFDNRFNEISSAHENRFDNAASNFENHYEEVARTHENRYEKMPRKQESRHEETSEADRHSRGQYHDVQDRDARKRFDRRRDQGTYQIPHKERFRGPSRTRNRREAQGRSRMSEGPVENEDLAIAEQISESTGITDMSVLLQVVRAVKHLDPEVMASLADMHTLMDNVKSGDSLSLEELYKILPPEICHLMDQGTITPEILKMFGGVTVYSPDEQMDADEARNYPRDYYHYQDNFNSEWSNETYDRY